MWARFVRLFTALCLLVLSACSNYLFQPLQQHLYTPDIVDVAYEDVYLESEPGLRLHGWRLLSGDKRKGVILYLHGNAENISTHFANMYWLTSHGYDGYIIDYRGYGKSDGVSDIDGVIRDVGAMIDHVAGVLTEDDVFIVMGHSLGGALAIYATSVSEHKSRISSLVTLEAFSDYRDVTRDVMSNSWLLWLLQYPVSWLMDNSYSPQRSVKGVSPVPILVMHSRRDEVIPYYHAMRLYETAIPPKQFIEIDSDHSHIFKSETSRALLIDYLESLD